MAKYYVRQIKFTETGRTYTIRDGEAKEKLDRLSQVAFSGQYSDLLNKPDNDIPDIPSSLINSKDLYLTWNHTRQRLEWRVIDGSSEPEYDPETQILNVSNEIYNINNQSLQSLSIEPLTV